jgi:hypothetical protein
VPCRTMRTRGAEWAPGPVRPLVLLVPFLGAPLLWVMPFGELPLAFAAVVTVHLVLNVVGFAVGARKTPI